MEKAPYSKYTKEFRLEAVRLVTEEGQLVNEMPMHLSMRKSALENRLRAFKNGKLECIGANHRLFSDVEMELAWAKRIKKVYADKGYAGEPNRDFLALNKIEDGIMRKDSTTAKLTELKIQRNKAISKIRYIACPVACQSPRGSHSLAIVDLARSS